MGQRGQRQMGQDLGQRGQMNSGNAPDFSGQMPQFGGEVPDLASGATEENGQNRQFGQRGQMPPEMNGQAPEDIELPEDLEITDTTRITNWFESLMETIRSWFRTTFN